MGGFFQLLEALPITDLFIASFVIGILFKFAGEFLHILRDTSQRKDEITEFLTQEEQHRQDAKLEREREDRIAERKRKIDSALSNRKEFTVIKSCKSCGANFGNGTVCQYCGQP
jgi:hypothetical protein